MIVSKKYDIFDNVELSTIGTDGLEGEVRNLGSDIKANGAEILGAEKSIELGGLKLIFKGSHGITGTGTISFEIYTGDASDKKVDTLGPYTADDLGCVRQFSLQEYDIVKNLKVKAVASASGAFTAGTIYMGLTTTL